MITVILVSFLAAATSVFGMSGHVQLIGTNVLYISNPNAEKVVEWHMTRLQDFSKKIEEYFEKADTENSMVVALKNLQTSSQDPKYSECFKIAPLFSKAEDQLKASMELCRIESVRKIKPVSNIFSKAFSRTKELDTQLTSALQSGLKYEKVPNLYDVRKGKILESLSDMISSQSEDKLNEILSKAFSDVQLDFQSCIVKKTKYLEVTSQVIKTCISKFPTTDKASADATGKKPEDAQGEAENGKGKPEDVEGAQGKPEDVEGTQGKPEDVKGAQGKPEDVGGTQGKPEDVVGTQGKPEDVVGTQGKPEDVKGAQGKPEDVVGTQGKPEDVKGAQGKPEDKEGTGGA